MPFTKRKIYNAVVLVLSALAASAATAQSAPSLLGGGSSLVAPMIGTEILPANFPVADGSIAYWSVGSGLGQTAFLTNNATKFTSITAGTTATASGTVDFANSDAPLSTAQVSAYTTTGGLGVTNGPLIQIPYIVTPITIPLVNAPTGTGPVLTGSTTPTVALNDDDLCGIFSGKLTDWNQVTNPDNGSLYSVISKPIRVVYEADNSGATDLLTAHLAQVCRKTTFVRGGVTAAANSNITFTESQNFAEQFFPSVPTNFIPATASSGVAASLLALSSSGIGYLGPDFTNTLLAPSSAPAAANNLSVASLSNQTTNADVIPTYQNATLALGTVALPTNPADPTQWVPNASNPSVGYPISGTSQIIASQCYANPGNTPTVAASVVDFLTLHYSSNAAILNGNGFAVVPANYVTAIKADFLSNSSGLKLNIGNLRVCANFAGR